jgi:uncharacterized protein involved in type VI secretion and phage assembly
VVGIVTNVNDSEGLGRIKVKLPTLGDQETGWVRLATPMSGNTYGLFFLPEVNDTVLVAFEEGDINHPYVVGSVWNGQDKPPKQASEIVAADGKVKQRIIKTRSGHIITIDDSDDAPGIEIKDKTGNNSIKLDSTNNALTIKVQGDMNIEAQGNMTLKGANVTVQATTGNLSAKAQGNFDAEASGTLTAKATGPLSVESQATATLKGNGPVTVQSSAITEVKGTLVKIN